MPADRSQNRKVFVGALTITGLIGVAALIFLVPDLFRFAERSLELVALMPGAGALEKGSPVWIAGRKVGEVKSVEFRGPQTDSTERIAVVLRVPRKYAGHIRKDSHVRITSERLIGEPAVDILPGSIASPPVQDHDSLHLRVSGTLEDVMNKTLVLTTDFDRLIVQMQKVERPAEQRTREMQRLRVNLARMTQEFRNVAAAIQNSPMRTFSDPEFRALLDRVNGNSRALRVQLSRAMQRARSAQSDAQPALNRMMARADTISSVIDTIRARIQTGGGGLLIRAQKDSAIVKALHEASVQLDSLMAETKRNPLRFWF